MDSTDMYDIFAMEWSILFEAIAYAACSCNLKTFDNNYIYSMCRAPNAELKLVEPYHLWFAFRRIIQICDNVCVYFLSGRRMV